MRNLACSPYEDLVSISSECEKLMIYDGPLGFSVKCQDGLFDRKTGCLNCERCQEEIKKDKLEKNRKIALGYFKRRFCPLLVNVDRGRTLDCLADRCVCFEDTGESYKCTMTGAERKYKIEYGKESGT